MKEIKVCYTNKANIGDAINPYIIRDVLHYEPVLADAYHCSISGIGSGLNRFFVNSGGIRTKVRLTSNKIKYRDPVILWSAGFITTPNGNETAIKRNIKVASVRGELSRQCVERLLKQTIECTTGDGGLLCSKWIPASDNKRFRLGIIPHVREKGEPIYEKICKSIPDSVIIDVEDTPQKTLKTISECECIISSSLHGLIIADSYHVPNKHVILTNKLIGDGFKFRDYYSSFGFTDDPLDLNRCSDISVNSIISDYSISNDMINQKQKEIIEAFNKYI